LIIKDWLDLVLSLRYKHNILKVTIVTYVCPTPEVDLLLAYSCSCNSQMKSLISPKYLRNLSYLCGTEKVTTDLLKSYIIGRLQPMGPKKQKATSRANGYIWKSYNVLFKKKNQLKLYEKLVQNMKHYSEEFAISRRCISTASRSLLSLRLRAFFHRTNLCGTKKLTSLTKWSHQPQKLVIIGVTGYICRRKVLIPSVGQKSLHRLQNGRSSPQKLIGVTG